MSFPKIDRAESAILNFRHFRHFTLLALFGSGLSGLDILDILTLFVIRFAIICFIQVKKPPGYVHIKRLLVLLFALL